EVAAMASSFIISIGFFVAAKQGHAIPDHWSLIITVLVSTLCWVSVTYLTAPTDRATLVSFYKRVRPAGPGWTSVRAEAGVGPSPDSLTVALGGWVLGCVFVYSALFGTGSFLYGKTSIATVWFAIFTVAGLGLWRILHLGQTKTAA
ncbi:MAG: Na+:solute symporter, partial [Gemmatimonadaceae bacterium]